MIYFNIGQIIANIICWALIAPTLDILIYNEPANKVYTQGVISAGVEYYFSWYYWDNILKAYASSQIKKGSLVKNNHFVESDM